jgi:hypothetical protein
MYSNHSRSFRLQREGNYGKMWIDDDVEQIQVSDWKTGASCKCFCLLVWPPPERRGGGLPILLGTDVSLRFSKHPPFIYRYSLFLKTTPNHIFVRWKSWPNHTFHNSVVNVINAGINLPPIHAKLSAYWYNRLMKNAPHLIGLDMVSINIAPVRRKKMKFHHLQFFGSGLFVQYP